MARKSEGNRDGENVLCPLFVAFTDNDIRCHPHVPDAAATILRYSDKSACYRQRKMYCEGCWERCEQYLTWLHFRWEDEE